jgi:cytochrome P450
VARFLHRVCRCVRLPQRNLHDTDEPALNLASALAAFDPTSLSFIAHPYPVYSALRQLGRIHYHPGVNLWLVTRHADVTALLRDRRFGRTYLHVATHAEMGRPDEPPEHAPFWHVNRNGMLDREPPDHTRLRNLVSKAFTPRTVEQLRPRIHMIVDKLVDQAQDLREFDFLATLAEPLPVTVIAELLGIPENDRHLLRPWSADICGMYELNPSETAAKRAVTACIEFGDYLRDLSRERRISPQNDLISALGQVVDAGDRLSEDELIGTCVLLLNAGHEASVNAAGNGLWALFRHPDQLARLRADFSLIPRAIDEMLRFDTPLQLFERWVLEDVEICGVRVPKGAELGLLFGSANRDPSAFENPDAFDIARDPNPHVSFGAGIHFCLGAALARLEAQILFESTLRRFPNFQLIAEPVWKHGYVIRGLQSLLVRA